MNVAYRPNTPLQLDSSEMMIASLFNNCFFHRLVYESALLNQEPYHNEFNLGKGQNRVGCRDVSTRLLGFTEDYDGWVVDLVGQGLVSDQRITLGPIIWRANALYLCRRYL